MAQASSSVKYQAEKLVPKNQVLIEPTKCKGCQLCVVVCATGNLHIDATRLNPKGYNPAVWVWEGDKGRCTGCENCYWVCPDAAILAVVVRLEAKA